MSLSTSDTCQYARLLVREVIPEPPIPVSQRISPQVAEDIDVPQGDAGVPVHDLGGLWVLS